MTAGHGLNLDKADALGAVLGCGQFQKLDEINQGTCTQIVHDVRASVLLLYCTVHIPQANTCKLAKLPDPSSYGGNRTTTLKQRLSDKTRYYKRKLPLAQLRNSSKHRLYLLTEQASLTTVRTLRQNDRFETEPWMVGPDAMFHNIPRREPKFLQWTLGFRGANPGVLLWQLNPPAYTRVVSVLLGSNGCTKFDSKEQKQFFVAIKV